MPLSQLRRVPLVVAGVSGPPDKSEAVLAALRGRFVHVLITDVETARLVLERADREGARPEPAMTSMRVARVVAPRDIRLEDAPVPVPARGEALVRIKAVGICGSDLHYYAHGRIGDLRFAPGHILGHEVSGVVDALGPGTAGPAPGTPVAVDPAIHCGTCRFCAEGHPNLCRDLRFFGSPPTPGALQEYLTHPAHLLHPLPAALPFPVGATIEPLGVAIHAVDLGHLALGATVAVFGCGPVGLMIAGVAQLAGARLVCAAEPLPHRRKMAAQFGVAVAFDPADDDVVRGIRDRTDGDGVDVAFEVAGSPSATAQAVQVVRPGGRSCWPGTGRRTRSRCRGSRPCARGSPSASSGA